MKHHFLAALVFSSEHAVTGGILQCRNGNGCSLKRYCASFMVQNLLGSENSSAHDTLDNEAKP